MTQTSSMSHIAVNEKQLLPKRWENTLKYLKHYCMASKMASNIHPLFHNDLQRSIEI